MQPYSGAGFVFQPVEIIRVVGFEGAHTIAVEIQLRFFANALEKINAFGGALVAFRNFISVVAADVGRVGGDENRFFTGPFPQCECALAFVDDERIRSFV